MGLTSTSIPNYSIAPYWVQLGWATEASQQGIYYQFGQNSLGGSTLSIEFYLTDYATLSKTFHYIVWYDSANAGTWWVYYFAASDQGAVETVGAQGYNFVSSKSLCIRLFLMHNFVVLISLQRL